MKLTIDLNATEEAALKERASADGTDMDTVVHGLIARLIAPSPSPAAARQSALAAMLSTHSREAQTEDPEAIAEREQELAELKANVDRWRAESGRQ